RSSLVLFAALPNSRVFSSQLSPLGNGGGMTVCPVGGHIAYRAARRVGSAAQWRPLSSHYCGKLSRGGRRAVGTNCPLSTRHCPFAIVTSPLAGPNRKWAMPTGQWAIDKTSPAMAGPPATGPALVYGLPSLAGMAGQGSLGRPSDGSRGAFG